MRVLVADDERGGRERLTELLGQVPDVQVVGAAHDGLGALDAMTTLRPDVAFLDIQMPGLTGFEALAEVPEAERPLVVFVTAHDQYAVDAFEVSAIDYLVKPVEPERLARTIERLRTRGSHANVSRLLADVRRNQPLRRVVGTYLRKRHVLLVDDVEAFVAEQALVFALMPTGRFLVNRTLRELEATLDPARFARVHKQAVVNLEKLKTLELIPKGGATGRLVSGTVIAISRRHVHPLRERLKW